MKSSTGLWMMVPAILCLPSCDFLEDAQSYVSPVAAEMILVNVPGDALAEYGVEADSVVSLYVAIGELTSVDASDPNPFSSESLADATVKVSTSNGTFELQRDSSGDGYFVVSSKDEADFTYEVGGEYEVNVSLAGEEYWAKFTATDEITLTEPESMSYHAPGSDLNVAWTPATDTGLTTVFSSDGEVAYDNLPRDANGIYSFLTETDVSSLTIPGDTFSADEVYGIAVAGLTKVEVDEAHFSSNFNPLVTKAATGTAVVTAVYTSDELPVDLETSFRY